MAVTVASLQAVLELSKDKFESGLGGAKDALGKLGPVAATAGGAIAAGVGIGVAAITGVGVAAFNTASDLKAASGDFAASLGISNEAAEKYEETMKGIFANNFGEDFADIGESLATISKTMLEIDDTQLQKATESALAIRDAFDKDVSESADAADALMAQFGLTSEQAFDFIASGLQNGLDRSDDFLDTIREYSNQFGDAGFSADQMFSILQSGLQSGVLGTDKIADAVKEMNIRLTEGGTAVQEGFGAIGLDFEQISASVAAGDETWADYFDNIVSGLQSIEDPIARQQAAVAIFGTMAEDLGPQFLDSLDPALSTLQDMTGATEALNAQYNTMGDAIEGFKRRALVAIEPIGEVLLELANKAMPFIDEFLTKAAPLFDEFAASLGDQLPALMASLGDSLSRIATVFGLTTEGASGMDAALAILKGTLDLILVVIDKIAVGFAKFAEALEIAKGLGQQIATINNLLGQRLGGEPGQGAIGPGGALDPIGQMLGFADGGIVPGPIGAPQMAIVHGGEEITPPGKGGGRSVVLNINNPVINGIDDANAMFANWANMLKAELEAA